MTVWDDGSGPALYVGGQFGTISGVRYREPARLPVTTPGRRPMAVKWLFLGHGLLTRMGFSEA
jgi:hypothetical protein